MSRRYFGSSRHSSGVVRSCSRCGRELTDAASRECGVGPVCRKKDNDIFARQIPANLSVALVAMLEMNADDFHSEIAGDFEAVRTIFVKKTEAARREFGADQMATIPGADFREVVDWLDMSLSYNVGRAQRNRVIGLIEDLGYVSLASVLRGDACMSPANLYIEGDRIFLEGKSNKSGFLAFRKAFGRSVKTPRYRGDSTPYSVHVSHAPKFVELALKHWPFMKDLDGVDALLSKAAEISENCNVEDTRPKAILVRNVSAGRLEVKVPWVGTRMQMQTMLNQFKEVPRSERKYNPATKVWTFDDKHTVHVLWAVKRTGLFQEPMVEAKRRTTCL